MYSLAVVIPSAVRFSFMNLVPIPLTIYLGASYPSFYLPFNLIIYCIQISTTSNFPGLSQAFNESWTKVARYIGLYEVLSFGSTYISIIYISSIIVVLFLHNYYIHKIYDVWLKRIKSNIYYFYLKACLIGSIINNID